MSKRNIIKIIGIVTLLNLASRLFGFVREMIISYHYGTSFKADSVVIAFTIPNFIYIVLGGAITTAFISIFNKIENENVKKQFKELIFTYSFVGTALLMTIFMLFSNQAIILFFPGLSPDQQSLTASLFLVIIPSILFLVMSMFLSGLQNVNGQYYRSSLATLVFNLLVVVIAVLLNPYLDTFSYSVGGVVGAFFMFGMLVYYVWKEQQLQFTLRWKIKQLHLVKRFLKVGIPILLGGATLQFYFLVHRIFASQLDEGFVSALNYSSKLVQLPQVILMTAVTTVIYPLLAKKNPKTELDAISSIYSRGMKQLFLFIVPTSVFAFFYAEEITTLIFEYGSFTKESTVMTAGLLKIFVIGMFAHAANLFVTRFFYAMERSVFPVLSGVIAVFGVNILIILSFMDLLGASAIAWGTTISAFFQLLLLVMAGNYMLGMPVVTKRGLGKYSVVLGILVVVMYGWRSIISLPFEWLELVASFLGLGCITIILFIKFKLVNLARGKKN
ncbi:murein biosynthesis integral membrane protein MurJ [Bacillus sp. AK128]